MFVNRANPLRQRVLNSPCLFRICIPIHDESLTKEETPMNFDGHSGFTHQRALKAPLEDDYKKDA